jgi:hypothetical protein
LGFLALPVEPLQITKEVLRDAPLCDCSFRVIEQPLFDRLAIHAETRMVLAGVIEDPQTGSTRLCPEIVIFDR